VPSSVTREDIAQDRLQRQVLQELIAFKLEGLIFDLRRKHSPDPTDTIAAPLLLLDTPEERITLRVDAHYGRPKTRAFLVFQAVWRKLSEHGHPFPSRLTFSKRELQRLTGTVWSKKNKEATMDAVYQLAYSHIRRNFQRSDKAGFEIEHDYTIFQQVMFEMQPDKSVSELVVVLNSHLHKSLNEYHYARFNWDRLNALQGQPIATILFKQFYQWGCNLMDDKTGKPTFTTLEKDYETICAQWLGGLTPSRYKAHITKQLGHHFAAIEATRLGKITVVKRKTGQGYKLVFKPSKGFFADYRNLYFERKKVVSTTSSPEVAAKDAESALLLTDHFHRELGRNLTEFQNREVGFIRQLLRTYTYAEVESLIEYTTSICRKNKRPPDAVNVVGVFIEPWNKNRLVLAERTKQHRAITSCSFCDKQGFMTLQDPHNSARRYAYECPHDPTDIAQIERHKGLKRVT